MYKYVVSVVVSEVQYYKQISRFASFSSFLILTCAFFYAKKSRRRKLRNLWAFDITLLSTSFASPPHQTNLLGIPPGNSLKPPTMSGSTGFPSKLIPPPSLRDWGCTLDPLSTRRQPPGRVIDPVQLVKRFRAVHHHRLEQNRDKLRIHTISVCTLDQIMV